MKIKSIMLLSLVAVGMQGLHAAKRKPAEEAVATKESKSDLKKLFNAIKNADLEAVKEQLKTASKQLLNEVDGKHSALGLAQHELERVKSKTSELPKAEKTTKTRRLNNIIKQLKEHGATMLYHNGARTAKAAE